MFVNSSFMNNWDLTLQLGFVIALANKNTIDNNNEFTICRNVIHFSSTKSKKVTWSILTSKVYSIVVGINMAYAIRTTLQMIATCLKLPHMLTIVYIDN